MNKHIVIETSKLTESDINWLTDYALLSDNDLAHTYTRALLRADTYAYILGVNRDELEAYNLYHDREEFMNLLYSHWLEHIL